MVQRPPNIDTNTPRVLLLICLLDGEAYARAAPDPELYGLHQYVDDPESTGTTALAGQVHAARLRRPDAADLGARQPVWAVRS